MTSLGQDELEEVYLLGVCRFVAALRLGPRRGFERIRAALSDKKSGAECGVWAGLSKCGAEHAEAGRGQDQGGASVGSGRSRVEEARSSAALIFGPRRGLD